MKTTTETYKGHTITLEWERDDFMGEPWKEHDGHGPVSDWTTRDKRAGEWVLCTGGRSKRFYDAQEAQKTARRDGWGLSPEDAAKLEKTLGRKPTAKEICAAAVERDFIHLRAWCNDEWGWVSYDCTITTPDGEEIRHDTLCGIESTYIDCYETVVIESVREWIDKEVANAFDAACRDVATA